MRALSLFLAVWLALLPLAFAHTAYAAPQPPPATLDARSGAPLEAGSHAVVRADGGCLRLRETPGTDARIITCLSEGTVVQVLAGIHEDGEYRWIEVSAGNQRGWVADEFLRATTDPAVSCNASAASTSRPGITGDLVPNGLSLVVWGGGTVNGVFTAAAAGGCELASVWASRPGGGLIGYLAGAPDFVNKGWHDNFAATNGRIPASPLMVVCGGTTSTIQGSSASASMLLPAWGLEPAGNGKPAPSISATSAVVIDEASGAILYEKDAHKPLAPASLTKIATAILAIEMADLDGWVHSEVDSRRMPGSSLMGLLPGDCFAMRDLLYGLMLPSGNDAALAIGRHIAGTDDAFLTMMNTLVRRMGLTATNFANPHGLDSSNHLTSAYDLAVMARYGMSLPDFAATVKTQSWSASGGRTLHMRNTNSFLSSYSGADGLKTGFTSNAGRTLAASAMRDGRRVYVVLLNAPDRFEDAKVLLDWVFETHIWPISQ